MFIITYKDSTGCISYYSGYSKSNFNKSFFSQYFGVCINDYITHFTKKIDEAKKFKNKITAKNEMKKLNVNYYKDDRYNIVEVN